MCFCISVFVILAHVASNLKSLNHESNDKEKIGPTKNSREKNSDPRNTHEKKFRAHEYPRENFGTTNSLLRFFSCFFGRLLLFFWFSFYCVTFCSRFSVRAKESVFFLYLLLFFLTPLDSFSLVNTCKTPFPESLF